jgi:hypothetical protein
VSPNKQLGFTMPTFAAVARLRYVMILAAIAQIYASWLIRGRQNDPLQNAPWWHIDYHSAVFVAVFGVLSTTIAFYLLQRRNADSWWSFALVGAAGGMLAGIIYAIATPAKDVYWVPIGPMIVRGILVGILTGATSYFISRKEEVPSEA